MAFVSRLFNPEVEIHIHIFVKGSDFQGHRKLQGHRQIDDFNMEFGIYQVIADYFASYEYTQECRRGKFIIPFYHSCIYSLQTRISLCW